MPHDEQKNWDADIRDRLREAMGNPDLARIFHPFSPSADQTTDGAGRQQSEQSRAAKMLERIKNFALKPRDVRDYLDRFVVRQDEAKKVLSVAICDHYNHVRQCMADPTLAERNHAKQNIVILGPTGVGKTYLMRCIARLIGVPFVKADATKFSETGYVGRDVEDLVRDLVKAADGDVDLAQYGIIYVDEADKLAAPPNTAGRDISGRGVQINLLKLMEDTDVPLQSQTDLLGQMESIMSLQRTGRSPRRTINTRHMLFIASGSFENMVEYIRRRLKSSAIGFAAGAGIDTESSGYLKLAQTSDFIDAGFEPEFIGRLPVRVHCDPLSIEDLEQVLLVSEDNLLDQYRRDFAGYGIEFSVTREAIREIATKAHAEKTGARGLLTVLERLFRDFKFELPSTSVKSFEISTDTVREPAAQLKVILKNHISKRRAAIESELTEFSKAFQREHGIALTFDSEAVAAIADLSVEVGKSVQVLCHERFRDFQHGLKLVAQATGATEFTMTREVVVAPEREIARLIEQTFRQNKNRNAEPGSG